MYVCMCTLNRECFDKMLRMSCGEMYSVYRKFRNLVIKNRVIYICYDCEPERGCMFECVYSPRKSRLNDSSSRVLLSEM